MVTPPQPTVHGDMSVRELHALGLNPDEVIDFAVNVSPWGPSPRVVEAVAKASMDRYPERDSETLRGALADSIGLRPDRLHVGNGATALIWSLLRTLVPRGERLLTVEPTFSEPRRAAVAHGAEVVSVWMRSETGFALDPAAIDAALERYQPTAAYLCLPNNPTGTMLLKSDALALFERHPGVTFLLDEAFLPVSDAHSDLDTPSPPNTVRVRSLTKHLAIPGLRLGYLVAEPALVTRLAAGEPPWSVSAPAQAAGLAALDDDQAATRVRWLEARRALTAELEALGLGVIPSAAPFVMVKVPDSSAVRQRCLKRGVLVRDCRSFGLDGFVRACARPPEDRARLIAALRTAIGEPAR